MTEYIFDFMIVASLIIIITALNGVITNFIGTSIFGGKQKTKFSDATTNTQIGWKSVGGKKK
ncbi:hypothetical protein IEO70_18625 [Bacillus sp. AGMB 02131]|uniref:Uncharacterized protein n=1 Tax=Peribacillus faecalis TaxID=2772559 RepID=A0A927HC11_9BACI|nr:hypothetical protein [Peribacillus faecalis]MBD3110345.1 hypothetical protein [Peribacillus faecalis]